ncbi:unnamed protein product [Microthlaspi erraticum]|uniref:DNA-directed RNA polymerase n=1 Tax=Microthlaspi erraticum TaxID=1685480 RepID=A0A6D2KA84_9BRAS|nr:unnamed protein product [Microthlaspi erraticum]
MDGFILEISGQLGKAMLGDGNKDGLYSILPRDYSSHAAAVCMNRLAKLSARWIGIHGFSIGIDDVQPGEALRRRRKETISEDKITATGKSYASGAAKTRLLKPLLHQTSNESPVVVPIKMVWLRPSSTSFPSRDLQHSRLIHPKSSYKASNSYH